MLNSLLIRNFRLFKNLEISSLGRVNLITGKNNSGKSSVLEALRIFAKRAKRPLLQEIASIHDEATPQPMFSSDRPEIGMREFAYQHLFPGREFPETDDIEIYIGEAGNEDERGIRIRHHFFEIEVEEVKDPETGEFTSRKKRKYLSKGSVDLDGPIEQGIVVLHDHGLHFIDLGEEPLRRSSAYWERPLAGEIPISYIPTRFLSSDVLAAQWDSLLFTEYADHVKSALRIIDPEFEDLGFIKKDMPVRRTEHERFALIKRKNSNKGIPLNSMGDGMLRILQLTLGLFQARGGLLLIDEFENGLHHTVQEEVWSKLFKLAESLDVQIFATAHSDDAIKAFSRASLKTDQHGVLINLSTSALENNKGAVTATVYDESQLDFIVDTGIEVRV